jgi:hypothetical protein
MSDCGANQDELTKQINGIIKSGKVTEEEIQAWIESVAKKNKPVKKKKHKKSSTGVVAVLVVVLVVVQGIIQGVIQGVISIECQERAKVVVQNGCRVAAAGRFRGGGN